MRKLLLCSIFCAGCFDYQGLSKTYADGGTDGAVEVDAATVDAAAEDSATVLGTDLAGVDFAGVDLTNVDFAAPRPASCADVLVANTGAPDGDYTLYVGHASNKPWTARCVGMATTPKEYLTLVMVGANQNYSMYLTGYFAGGTNTVTTYVKVRVDPATLMVDTSDQTFASSTGATTINTTTVTSMSYAAGASCSPSASGPGNVDLRGTPFQAKTGIFVVDGNEKAGIAVYTNNNQTVDIHGGGTCGWCAAGAYSFSTGPTNGAGAFQLQLVYP